MRAIATPASSGGSRRQRSSRGRRVQGRSRLRPAGLILLVGAALAIGVGCYGALRAVGSRALHRAERSEAEGRISLGNFDAISIAAAMPGSREDALDELQREMVFQFART